MITASIFIGQGEVAEMQKTIEDELTKLKAYEADGKIVFVSLSSVAKIWQEDYNAKGYLFIHP